MKKIINLKGLLALFIVSSSLLGQSAGTKDSTVTPVSGESWLSHLHRPFDGTSMGKTWDMGPSVPKPGERSDEWQAALTPAPLLEEYLIAGRTLRS